MLQKILTFFCLTVIILATSWSLLHPHFFRVHDFTQAGRVAEMARAIQDGHLIPRWSQNFGFGYGMPLFEFYAPLPYYVGAALILSGLPMIVVLKLLFLIANIGTAIGSYKAGRVLFGSTYGWVLAALVTAAPYRAVNLYVRGAVGEAWGLMMLPWILYGSLLIFKHKRSGVLITSLAVAGLCLSHNLTTLISVITLLFFACLGIALKVKVLTSITTKKQLTFIKEEVLKPLCLYLGSILLGIGMAAYYVFPALFEKDFTQVEQSVINEYFDYKIHFVIIRQFFNNTWGYGGSIGGIEDGISFYLGSVQLLLAATVCLIAGIRIFQMFKSKASLVSRSSFTVTLITGVALAVNLFMTTHRSQSIWDLVQPLHFIQFPWRWLNTAVIWLGLFAGLSIVAVRHKLHRVILAICLVIITVATSYTYFKPEQYLEMFDEYYYTDETAIASRLSETLFDYMPRAVPLSIEPSGELLLCATDATCPEFHVTQNKTHIKKFTYNSTTESLVTAAVADYPGWQVKINDKLVNHTTTIDGLIQFTIPQGENTVRLVFGSTPIRSTFDTISLISWLVLLSVVIHTSRPHAIKETKHT